MHYIVWVLVWVLLKCYCVRRWYQKMVFLSSSFMFDSFKKIYYYWGVQLMMNFIH